AGDEPRRRGPDRGTEPAPAQFVTLLAVEELSVAFPTPEGDVQAVRGINLSLPANGRLALLGESGSGKSVTALAIAGLLPPEARLAGAIRWPGLDRPARSGRDLGFVFQDPLASLNPVLTVGEQIAEVLATHAGLGWRTALARAEELLVAVGLAE